MVLIGVMGGIGHGKTSFAEALQKIEPNAIVLETSTLITQVVNEWQQNTNVIPVASDLKRTNEWLSPLPAILGSLLDSSVNPDLFVLSGEAVNANQDIHKKLFQYIDQAELHPSILSTKITTENKSDYRPILQWLGGYVQYTLPEGFWFRVLINHSRALAQTETSLAILSGVRYEADANVIKHHAGYVIEIYRPNMSTTDPDEVTERAKKYINRDSVIINDADLDGLSLCARSVLEDIRNGMLKKQYVVSIMRSRSATIKKLRSDRSN